MDTISAEVSLLGRICLLGILLCFVVHFLDDRSLPRTRSSLIPSSSHRSDDDFYREPKKLADCLGAPYLYVTVHDRTANVLKYSRDGCLLSDEVLIMDRSSSNSDIEFRSMAVGKHKGQEVLFIVDASNINSRLLMYGKCLEDDNNYGRRPYIQTIAESNRNPGVDHAYGVCLDKDGNVYISNQHTDCILRFQVGDFHPMEFPHSLQLDHRVDYFTGTFVQFGLPEEHVRDKQGLRSIVHVKSRIWIAHEDLLGVAVVDIDTGLVIDIIRLDVPIGLHFDEDSGLVFVSCKSDDGGMIYALNYETYEIRNKYHHHKMEHPTGTV